MQPGLGVRALRSIPATGRPRTLTPRQESQVFRWVNGRDPRQYGLDFGLWTRAMVGELIEHKYDVRLGLTPQKPLQRACQRDPEAIERWQREVFPAIARQARKDGADIFFWDESDFRADTVHGKTWGLRGHTPVVQRPGQRQSISAASAFNANRVFWFRTYEGALTAEIFIDLLGRLMQDRQKPLHLVVDGLPAHKTALVKQYVASTEGHLILHVLPGYAPEIIPTRWSGVMSSAQGRPDARCARAKNSVTRSRSNSPGCSRFPT